MKALLALPVALVSLVSAATGQARPYSSADSLFMSGMIPHHAQAIVMSGLVPDRAAHPQVRILGERITVSQRDEITAMRTWLEQHGLPMPDTAHHHLGHGAGAMPGMLTPAQIQALEAAKGADFDRLYVTLMIQHHQGALIMVAGLMRSDGGAQDSFVYRLASDIHADQSAEIERMARLLVTLPLPERSP